MSLRWIMFVGRRPSTFLRKRLLCQRKTRSRNRRRRLMNRSRNLFLEGRLAMVFKDSGGKDLEVGQEVVYVDPGMMRGEIIEIEHVSSLDGNRPRNPKVFLKIALNFDSAPPGISMIMVGNMAVTKDAPPKISPVRN